MSAIEALLEWCHCPSGNPLRNNTTQSCINRLFAGKSRRVTVAIGEYCSAMQRFGVVFSEIRSRGIFFLGKGELQDEVSTQWNQSAKADEGCGCVSSAWSSEVEEWGCGEDGWRAEGQRHGTSRVQPTMHATRPPSHISSMHPHIPHPATSPPAHRSSLHTSKSGCVSL